MVLFSRRRHPWPLFHRGNQGPCVRQVLLESDLLWQGGPVPTDPVPARQRSIFPSSTAAVHGPHWLADLATVAADESAISPVLSKEAPSWLEDMRLWIGLEVLGENKTPPVAAANTLIRKASDWLAGWIPDEPARDSKSEKTKQTVKIQEDLADTTIRKQALISRPVKSSTRRNSANGKGRPAHNNPPLPTNPYSKSSARPASPLKTGSTTIAAGP